MKSAASLERQDGECLVQCGLIEQSQPAFASCAKVSAGHSVGELNITRPEGQQHAVPVDFTIGRTRDPNHQSLHSPSPAREMQAVERNAVELNGNCMDSSPGETLVDINHAVSA